MTDRERWQRVKLLFEAAMEQSAMPPEDFAAQASDDAEVREEALRLLTQRHELEAGFLEPAGKATLLDRAARAMAGMAALDYQGRLLAGRYLIERELGRGGSGVVYVAQDRQLHSRRVVVKLLHAAWDEQERVQLKFRQEMEALSRIHHPAVVGVLDAGQTEDGRAFLALEYVDGETLRSRLERGPVRLEETRRIATAVCEALDAAHAKGILHRDVKPENIILVSGAGPSSCAVKLIDFGIAKVHDSLDRKSTETISVMGTAPYAAPEQLMGQACRQSDIYSLAAVCYEMLTGRTPFDAATPVQLYESQRKSKAAAPSRLSTEGDKKTDAALLRALSFRAEDRQGSAREFAEEFAGVSAPKRRWRISRRVAALALVVGGSAAVWEWRNAREANIPRVVAIESGRDPEEYGFARLLDLTERAVPNADHTGFDAVRLTTSEQGSYSHPLSKEQERSALRNGWKLAATARPVEGGGGVQVDLSPEGGRYDCDFFLNEAGRQVVQLNTRIARGVAGPQYEIEGPPDAFHDFELVYEPERQAAKLLVDGVERLRGYKGHGEYLGPYGVMFGVAAYRSQRAEAIFRNVRFEIGGGAGGRGAILPGR